MAWDTDWDKSWQDPGSGQGDDLRGKQKVAVVFTDADLAGLRSAAQTLESATRVLMDCETCKRLAPDLASAADHVRRALGKAEHPTGATLWFGKR